MGLTPEFLPGYQPGKTSPDLFESCKDGTIKFLYIAGEDPVQSFYRPQLVKDALQTVPFLIVTDVFMTETARMADLILPASTSAEKDGTFTNMSRHVQGVASALLPQGTSKPDFDILLELAEAMGKPFKSTCITEVQQDIEQAAPIYKGVFPADGSKQWSPAASNKKPAFKTVPAVGEPQAAQDNYPFTLQTNNHMFHIGGYSQYAKALVEIGPECIAEIHPDDAKAMGVSSGDEVVVESSSNKVQVKIKTTRVTSKGMVYIPKNWPKVAVNDLRNGEEGLIKVKVSKSS
jgi:predicted molibdopterin-dependent oxidoreductase YjgC